MQNYILRQKRKVDEMVDYVVWFENLEIAILNININKENIFIRQIRVFENFKRQGHASRIIEFLLEKYNRPIRLCIATNSKSAVAFWGDFLKTHKNNHIRGEIYELTN